MEKFKQIQNRLNAVSIQPDSIHDGPNKARIRQLQSMISRLTSNLQQDDITRQYKLNQMLQKLRKIQSSLKQSNQQSIIKQSAFQATLNRVEKNLKKKIQKLSKIKKQADKDFQSCLNNYLIQLTGFKSKMSHGCLSHVNQLKQKQTQIQQLHKNHVQNQLVTKQILKKIYNQYTSQLEQINKMILEEQNQRKVQEQILIEKLQKMYQKKKKQLKQIKKYREKSEGQMIQLLQKVVERVRLEVVKM